MMKKGVPTPGRPSNALAPNSGKSNSAGRRHPSEAGNTSSSNIRVPLLIASLENYMDCTLASPSFTSFPEWNDADIQAEKWVTKHAFEETDPFRDLPGNLRNNQIGLKRIQELSVAAGAPEIQLSVVLPATLSPAVEGDQFCLSIQEIERIEQQKLPIEVSQTTDSEVKPSSVTFEPAKEEPAFIMPESLISESSSPEIQVLTQTYNEEILPNPQKKQLKFTESPFYLANKHLEESEFMKFLLADLCLLIDCFRQNKASGIASDDAPWDAIYPKGKDGLPSFNASGKYAIRLFLGGTWRKIIVDDRVPVDAQGKSLLPTSASANEIWPLLLSKAICKSLSQCDLNEINFVQVLTGYIPETISLNVSEKVWEGLSGLLYRQMSAKSGSSPSKANTVNTTPNKQQFMMCALKRDNSQLVRAKVLEVKQLAEDEGGAVKRIIRLRLSTTPGSLSESIDLIPDENKSKATDFEMSYESFVESFDSVCAFHSPKSFSYEKTIKYFPSSSEEGVTYQQNLVLYSENNNTQQTNVVMLLSCVKPKSQSVNCSGMIDKYSWKTIANSAILKLDPFGCTASLFSFPPNSKEGYKISIESPCGFVLSVYSKESFKIEDESVYLEQRQLAKCVDLNGSYNSQQSNSYFILFRRLISVSAETIVAVQLHFQERLLNLYSKVSIYDLDTQQCLEESIMNKVLCVLKPNTKGYLFVADSRSPKQISANKFVTRFISDLPLIQENSLPSNATVVDLEDYYLPNKNRILTRQFLKRKDDADENQKEIEGLSIQLSFSLPYVGLVLQIFEEDKLIFESKGKGSVVIPLIFLWKKDDKGSDKRRFLVVGSADEQDIIQNVIIPYNSIYSSPTELNSILTKVKRISSAAPTAVDKKKKGVEKEKQNAAPEVSVETAGLDGVLPSWRLRIIHQEGFPLSITKDNEKEDRLKSTKANWESVSGRASKARELRDSVVKKNSSKSSESSNFHSPQIRSIIDKEPIEFMTIERHNQIWNHLSLPYACQKPSDLNLKYPWFNLFETEHVHLMTEEILDLKEKARVKGKENFEIFNSQIHEMRNFEKNNQVSSSVSYLENITAKMNEWKAFRVEDEMKREDYRLAVEKRLEEARALAEPDRTEEVKSAGKDKGKKDVKKPAGKK